MNRKIFAVLFSAAVLMVYAVAVFANGHNETGMTGNVYTMTNAADGNEIIIFDRDAKGMLSEAGSIATDGDGSGGGLDPLGSQGSLVLSKDQRWLLAVNAGSDEISVFKVVPDGLVLTHTISSEGDFPVSLTIYHNLVFVLNAGSPNITGFTLSHAGMLTPLAGSTRALGSGAFAQVGFDPLGKKLVVTDRGENEILVYEVGNDGLPGMMPTTTMSNGLVPFGFIFDLQGNLLVAEAGSGAVSSYSILSDGSLQMISPSAANGQAATCWIAGNGRYAFTANTASSNLSGYTIKRGEGSIMLNEAVAGAGNLDIDIDVSIDGRFLYALNAGDGTIGMFRITPNGRLVDLGITGDVGLSIFAQGIAVR